MVTKKKVDLQAVEVNTSQTPTGKLLLGGIAGQACTVRDLSSSLMDFGWYGSYDDGDGETTPVPEAVMELVTAMKDSAKNVLRMVNMFARAEGAAPVPDDDGDETSEPIGESRVLFESADGQMTVEFTEAGSAQIVKGQVSGTMLVAGKNANATRFYSEESLIDAVDRGLWNGKKMYLDHMTESEKRDRPARSIKDIAAIIKETRYDAGTKSIKYVAQLADPVFETKLTYMQEHGILGSIGVSIHASAQGTKAVVDSSPMLMVERFVEAYSSDFVTSPGAGGSIDVLESAETDDSQVEITNGRTTMDKETMAAIAELVKGIVTEAVAPIATSQAALSGRMETVEAQAQIATLIESSDLPDAFKTSLIKRFGKSTSVEGVEEAITDTKAAVATLTTDKKVEDTTEVRRVAKPSPVHGMGSQVTEAGAKVYRGYEDFANSPASALLGGKAKVEKLFESLR